MIIYNVQTLSHDINDTYSVLDGYYIETSIYLNNAKVYNNINNTKFFIFKLPFNNLSLDEKYKDFNPLKLYEGRWVIGYIEGMQSSTTSVWAYSNKRVESDSLEESDIEWYDCKDNSKIIINII